MPTLRQIALTAGVSASTVSLVLNDRGGVSPDKRDAVYAAIQRLEAGNGGAPYLRSERSMQGKNLRSKRSKRSNEGEDMQAWSVIVLHPPVPSSYDVFAQVLQGIQSAAEANGMQLRLVANDPDMTEEHLAYQYLRDERLRPDGLIMFGARENEPLLLESAIEGVPCVVLGRDVGSYDFSGLGRNEMMCGYLAARHLLELGHQAIAFVGGEGGFDYVRNRMLGYQQAMKQVGGVKVLPEWVRHGDAISATAAVLDSAPDVTAIIFVNDQYAADGLLVIRQRGLSIPHDLSVVSFDNTEIARGAKPPLTSVSYHFFEEGQWAVRMLIDLIHYPMLDMVHTYFKADLIQRKSSAPPRK